MIKKGTFKLKKGLAEMLKGGVIGGSLIHGVLKQGEEIEIAPGRKVEVEGKNTLEAITATIGSLFTGGKSVKEATPGGLIARYEP